MADLGGPSRRSHQRTSRRLGAPPLSVSPLAQGRQRSQRRQVLNLPPTRRPSADGAPPSRPGSEQRRLETGRLETGRLETGRLEASAGVNRSAGPSEGSSEAPTTLRLLQAAQPHRRTAPPHQAAKPASLPSSSSQRRRRPQISDYASAFGGRRQAKRSRQQSAARSLAKAPSGAIARRKSPQLTPVPPPSAIPLTPTRPRQTRRPQPQRPQRRQRQQRRPVPTWLYALRLLILGLGIGAIAGTLLSVLNPARQSARQSAQQSDSLVTSQTAAGTVAAPATAPLALGSEMTRLKTDISAAIAAYPDLSPGVMILDLDTGGHVDINAQQPMASASIIKVPILVAFLQSVESGAIDLNKSLTLQEADIVGEAGEMQFQPPGTAYTALETAADMITISDNTATNVLIRELGGKGALNQRFSQWGLTQTTISESLPDLEGQNRTTPMEMVTLLAWISNGDLLSSRSRDRMFDIMRDTMTDSLLPQGIALEAAIAHKTGTIGSMLGDVGIVDTPAGKRYAIAVMVERPHGDEQAIDVIQQVSALVYDAFSDGGTALQ